MLNKKAIVKLGIIIGVLFFLGSLSNIYFTIKQRFHNQAQYLVIGELAQQVARLELKNQITITYTTSSLMTGTELYLTSLYDDKNLLAYYKLEDNADTKGNYNLTNDTTDGPLTFQIAKFNTGSDSGGSWQKDIGRYNEDLVIPNGKTPMSVSAWVSVNSQPPDGLDGDFVVVSTASHTVNYALGYGWFDGAKKIFFSRARLGIVSDRNTYSFTMVPGTFYHLIGTWDGAGMIKLYLNGTNVASLPGVSTGDGSGAYARGLGINGTWSNINTIQGGVGGRVDDVAIFNRILTPTDIDLLIKPVSR